MFHDRTQQYWTDLVRVGVRLRDSFDADEIGRLCFEADQSGDNPAVWHMAAKFYGTPCHCAKCAPRRT